MKVIITFLYLILSLTALDELHYSPEEKTDLQKEYFYRLAEELLRSPEDYLHLTLWNAFIIVGKS